MKWLCIIWNLTRAKPQTPSVEIRFGCHPSSTHTDLMICKRENVPLEVYKHEDKTASGVQLCAGTTP
jgi:hypothetical protein